MSGSTLWKFLLSAVIVFTAILYLNPIRDTQFKEYLLEECNGAEAFISLLGEAETAYGNDDYSSIYLALRAIALEREIDLAQYFPHLTLESSMRNTERRNQVLLDALLDASKSRLQPGLRFKGGSGLCHGVGFIGSDRLLREGNRSGAGHRHSGQPDQFPGGDRAGHPPGGRKPY